MALPKSLFASFFKMSAASILLVSAIPFSLHADPSHEHHDQCMELAQIAEIIMEMRQYGLDIETAFALIETSLVEDDEDREFFYFMAEAAWRQPVGSSLALQGEEIEAYGAYVYHLCIR
jgi:hypothetical protein